MARGDVARGLHPGRVRAARGLGVDGMTDAEALKYAHGLVAEVMGTPKAYPRTAKKLDALSKSRGLAESTRVALRYARDGLDAGAQGYAWQILVKAKEAIQ